MSRVRGPDGVPVVVETHDVGTHIALDALGARRGLVDHDLVDTRRPAPRATRTRSAREPDLASDISQALSRGEPFTLALTDLVSQAALRDSPFGKLLAARFTRNAGTRISPDPYRWLLEVLCNSADA